MCRMVTRVGGWFNWLVSIRGERGEFDLEEGKGSCEAEMEQREDEAL